MAKSAAQFKKIVGGKVGQMSSPKKLFTGKPGGAAPKGKGGGCGKK